MEAEASLDMQSEPLVDAPARASNPVWLAPTALTIVAFYQKLIEVGQIIGAVTDKWMEVARSFWRHALEIAAGPEAVTVDESTGDMLTLWVVASLAIWLLPFATPGRGARVKTTVAVIAESLRMPRVLARALGFLIIALSAFVVMAPFALGDANLVQTMRGSGLLAPEGTAFGDWLSGDGVWLAGVLALVGAGLLSYEFFVIGPKLEAAPVTRTEARDLIVIAVVLWAISAACIFVAVTAPATGVQFLGVSLSKADAMVGALIALIGLVVWRSALPLVQLAGLVVVVLVIDGAYDFVTELVARMQS